MEPAQIGLVFWALGGIVGYAAAKKKGWSPVMGFIGGLLLGILSPLLFFVSGVTKGDKSKVCPKCAERVKAEALVCRYCGAELAADRKGLGMKMPGSR